MRLGELEKAVLHYFWEYSEADVKQVHAYFSAIRPGSLNTIQSTLDRLYKKGLLKREKRSHAYVYRKALEKEIFVGRLVVDVAQDFLDPSENILQAAFASLSSDLTDEDFDELEALIEAHRNPVGKSG